MHWDIIYLENSSYCCCFARKHPLVSAGLCPCSIRDYFPHLFALINASSRSLWALSEETGHETNGRQAEGCGMWKPCRNVFEYHHRKGFGGFAVVVMLHSRGEAVPLELCPIRLLGWRDFTSRAVSAQKILQGWQYPGISCTQQTVTGEHQTSAQNK